MATLDLVFGSVLLLSLLLGAWRGLVYELLSALSWIAAFFLAQWLAPELARLLPPAWGGETLRYVGAFALLFVLSVFVGGLVAKLLKTLFAAAGLQPVDRALGAAFGALRGVVLLLAATLVIGMTPLQSSHWWRESAFAGLTTATLRGLAPMLPAVFEKYLPS